MNPKERLILPAHVVVAVSALLAGTLAGCSAIELYHSNATASAEAAADVVAATVNPTLLALQTAGADMQMTGQALSADATESAATSAALAATPASAPTFADAFSLPASAETVVYGSVPIDSDRLNIIAALAFDADGNLFAATRAGEIYALPDSDRDGSADETRLIFADDEEALGQVAGLTARGKALILLNGERLSLLRDSDGDGRYETVTHLSGQLPADQSPLQASNGIVFAPDGRLFTVDIKSGEILQIILRE